MTLTSSITNAVVILIVVVVVIGALLGFTISGSDWVNPFSGAAQERRMDAETEHLDNLNQLAEQKLEAQNQIEIAYAQRKAEINLTLLPFREYAFTAAGAVAFVIVSVGLAVSMIRLSQRLPNTSQSDKAWQARAYREARIGAARAHEQYLRETLPAQPEPHAQRGNGRSREPAPSNV